ncbi:endonuclease [Leisingera sp. ANG-M1]|uniref:relaxase/mobilization nuclease domain-containing protein n=1 Tax=Leisingera sp. ANG-M1 TaxID=1577895 RepID=UPI00057E6D69|nr:relaxase/mobilization nuclease domain-containing protein [Leisingera sp. ANG-M1]KIC08868.1 endonuclease [Leisingera sp. ANG-M1]
MGNQDRLSLYHSVMGELWEEEHRRAGSAREKAAARQVRSYRKSGQPSVRNIAKAARGSRAAVFKRIRNGGCKTRRSLGSQLDYVNDKAVFTFSTSTNLLTSGATLNAEQKEQIVEQWSGTWRGTAKLGFTSHMLLSFPKDVTADQVRDIAMDWCEHFFESGYYGDEWDYVAAIHTDREHPHAHILLNNRGRDQGLWFSCWAGGVMSPQLMREKQAEIAEQYGVSLDATTRLERGIFARPAGLEEIYAAKAEGRSAREIALTPQEEAMAQAAVTDFAKEYRNVADLLNRGDRSELASSVRQMAATLDAGQAWDLEQGDFDMSGIQTVGEAIEYAERRIDEIRTHAEGLAQPERTAFELRAAPVIASLSKMVPDPDLRVSYNQELADPYPPGAGVIGLADALADRENSKELSQILQDGQELGLNTDETLARLEAGGTRNHGLAKEWVDRDLSAILSRQGLRLEEATEEQLDAAFGTLDHFQMRLANALGAEMKSAFAALEGEDLVRSAGSAAAEDSRTGSAYIRQLAEELRSGDLESSREEALQKTLLGELHRELGDKGLAELDRGNWQVLEEVLPGKGDQIAVTQAYLEAAAEERGEPELAETAAELQQVKSSERAKEIAAGLQRDCGLDDELDL